MRGQGVGVQRDERGAQKEGGVVVLPLEVSSIVLQDALIPEDAFGQSKIRAFVLVLHVFVPVDASVLVPLFRWTQRSNSYPSHRSLKDEVRTTSIHSLLEFWEEGGR